jgi:YegS/Rv2252/BmrU family lipid kinase
LKHIHFIINPVAGSGNYQIPFELLEKYFDKSNFAISVKHSTYKKHSVALTQESIAENADIIVACGGDGTINEVASCLVGTDIKLGIIATGSGNGLASNLNIPKSIVKSLLTIKKQSVKQIDVGKINDKYFFSNTGVGFDAKVVKHYEESNQRRLSSYLKATFKTLNELDSDNTMKIDANDKNMELNPFLVFVSNSNEMGYNMSLTPNASLQDGLLDVIIIPKIGKLKFMWLGMLMFFKRLHIIKDIKSFQTEKLKLYKKGKEAFQTQIDGELYYFNANTINISILKKSLYVIS